METRLADFIKNTPQGEEADSILRACVHCGFCTATCPTYQLLGDELDGPRGRIYQIKQVLEGAAATRSTQLHLDRCLTCRSCETTCPSGVKYGRLLDIGREVVGQQIKRPVLQSTIRWTLRKLLTTPGVFAPALAMGRLVRPVLPDLLKKKIPPAQEAPPAPTTAHERKVIVAEGCVQPTYKPATNVALSRVLDRLGIETIKAAGERCCGAASFHLDAAEEAKTLMRANIDAWWPHVEAGAEAIISTASGCGVMIKDYAHVLADDEDYAVKAQRVSALAKDVVELMEQEDLSAIETSHPVRIAFQSPCTLQHGQKLAGRVEALLRKVGYRLTPVTDPHLCCGSAGTYSVLQKDIALKLRAGKISALEQGGPKIIATANIGCHLHLEEATDIPVKHWVELLDDPALPL